MPSPSVIDVFFNYLNTHPLDDTNARIMRFLLEHLASVGNLTITQVSRECYVSPASITRFVQRFKLGSFTALKKQLAQEPAHNAMASFQLTAEDRGVLTHVPQRYLNEYAQRVQDSIFNAAHSLDMAQVISLVHLLESPNRVFLFGFDSIIDYLRRFQGSLMLGGKYAFLGETLEASESLVECLREGDLCLVVSSFGQFFRYRHNLVDRMGASPARTVLITQSSSIFEASSFDETIVITNQPDPRAGSFCMEFYLEFVGRLVYARHLERVSQSRSRQK